MPWAGNRSMRGTQSSESESPGNSGRLMSGRSLFFRLLVHFIRKGECTMGKADYLNGGFVACIPHQIEANGDGELGPHVAGFPLNIVYLFVQKSKVDESEILGAVTACYEPDLATFRETKKTREMTYFNRAGGTYRVRVVMDKKSGLLETFKYRGKKLVAYASGPDFDNAMLHTTLIGIEKDEPVRVLEIPR